MNKERQRIKIAEACGWKRHPLQMNKNFWIHFPSEKQARDDSDLPDYLNDLNAMHEAERHLGLRYDQWTRELRAICERDRRCVEGATAAQRAEAFLKTLGLWEETN